MGADGSLWIGTNVGVDRLKDETAGFEPVALNVGGEPDDPIFVSAIWVESEDVVWIGTLGRGLLKYWPENGSVEQFRHDPSDPTSLSSNRVTCIAAGPGDTLWVGTRNGLNAMDRRIKTFTVYRHDPGDAHSLSHNSILSLLEDRAGDLWIGTNGGGLNRLLRETGRFARYTNDPSDPASLSHNTVNALYQDPAGVLWVGTDNGLNRLTTIPDPQKDDGSITEFIRYYQSDGLPNDHIAGILGDRQGNLWLSTNQGVSRLDPGAPPGQQFRNYGASDGLQGTSFLDGSFYQSPSGELFFGGVHGLNRFYPSQVRDNPYPPPVVLTSFTIFDKPARLDTAISEIRRIRLTHKQNFFSFEFAALDYTRPEKNQYAYRMDGFDQQWIHAGHRRYASYTNLDPGTYWFRVRGSNNDGVWNETGTSVQIVISPPSWQRWWFRLLLAAALLLVAVAGYKLRVSKLLEIERIRVRIASDLHDDIGSTLTKISLYSDLIRTGTDQATTEGLLEKIGSLSRSLVTTMSDIVWSIDSRNDTIGDLLDRMHDLVTITGAEHRMQVRFETEGLDADRKLPADVRQNLYLILKEAVNNVVKHAQASTLVVRLRNVHRTFTMEIRDDGVGFDLDIRPRGQGLRNMEMRARRIGARLDIHVENGVTVRVERKRL